jgi:hypothetical protein
VKRERNHIVACRELTEQPIRGRTGRAALRRKEFTTTLPEPARAGPKTSTAAIAAACDIFL